MAYGVSKCARRAYNLCPTHGSAHSASAPTVHGRAVSVTPSARLVLLPPGFDVRDASMWRPAAVSWHALGRRHRSGTGSVVGAGRSGCSPCRCPAGSEPDGRARARHPYQKEGRRRRGAIEAVGVYESSSSGRTSKRPGQCGSSSHRRTIVVLGVHFGPSSLTERVPQEAGGPVVGYCARRGGRRTGRCMLADDPDMSAP